MALIPSWYLDAVISIGTIEKDSFRSLATGFLAAFLTGSNTEDGKPIYVFCLLTNRHVFADFKKVILRFNLTEAGSKTYEIDLIDSQGNLVWVAHPNDNVDIAAIPINRDLLVKDGIRLRFIPEENMAFMDTIKKRGIAQGDGVFVLGFPMGIAGVARNYVLARGGIISRLDDEVINQDYAFYIDANIFPGNSGSPVILRPEIVSIEGTEPVNKAYLIGTVSSYIPYKEEAVSKQDGKTRIVFMENSGIATVVPMDFAKQTVEPFLSKFKEQRRDTKSI